MPDDKSRQGGTGLLPFGGRDGNDEWWFSTHQTGERQYDPVVGRFISEDPIRQARGDNNLEMYVGNNPINKIDPSGMAPEPAKPASNSGASLNFGGEIGTTVTVDGHTYRWETNPADPSRPSLVRIDGQPNPIQFDPATGQGVKPGHVVTITVDPPYEDSKQHYVDRWEGYKIGVADSLHGLALAGKFVWDSTLGNSGHSSVAQEEVREYNAKMEQRLDKKFTLPSDNRSPEERNANVGLAFLGWNLLAIGATGPKAKATGAGVLAETRGAKLADIFTGVPDDAMVHVSPATPAELESGVLVSPGTSRSYWARWGDIKGLTPTQYRGFVGGLAKGGLENANTFVFKLTNANTEGAFIQGSTNKFSGITEYTATQTITPDAIGVAK